MSEQIFHWIIKGKVQGVWFRAGTLDQAKTLGLVGWVRNIPDGGVEVWAKGDAQEIAKLQTWLRQGPQNARVEEIIELPAVAEDRDSFEVL